MRDSTGFSAADAGQCPKSSALLSWAMGEGDRIGRQEPGEMANERDGQREPIADYGYDGERIRTWVQMSAYSVSF